MQFLLEQYSKNKDQGLDYLKVEEYEQARYHLLIAAKYLLKAAQESEPKLQKIRHDKALQLRDLAFSLKDKKAPAGHGKRTAGEKAPAGKDQDGDLTPESKWIVSEKPNVRFDQIAGLDNVKEAINLRVIYPFRHPEAANRFKKRAGGGMLLYGPPGVGKTMIAKAIATEMDAQFLNVKSSNIMSQWVGVAEQNLARLFEVARRYPISVVFLDETEALVGKRGGQSTVMNRVVPEFLSQVDGLDPKVNCILLMGATNRPWDMDEAALRTGRFGEKFYVGLPEVAAREQILHFNLDGIPIESNVDFHALAEKLDGYSGADISGVCIKATDLPFRRQIRSGADTILMAADLEQAVKEVPPSVNSAMLDRYRKFAEGS
ncbi:MAG: ATP-binding protein [Acidobacteriota bacterium]|jgi:transitional endoplasmic reticulum ATPase